MTRFIYIADTHMGASPMRYQQQKGYPEKLNQILLALAEHLRRDGAIDFILHGGDMIESTSDDNISRAAEAFAFDVPVYLCLGNHDLTTPNAADRWLQLAPQFFKNNAPDYSVQSEDCVLHVAPNHWCEKPFYWNGAQAPRFSKDQLERLSRDLAAKPNLPHLLVTHSPVHGVPASQTGFSEPFHAPDPSFTTAVTKLISVSPGMRCVLGAHTHMNMRLNCDDVEFVTTSPLVETPFDFKLFEVTSRRLAMSTISLRSTVGFESDYDSKKAFIQGGTEERSFSIALS